MQIKNLCIKLANHGLSTKGRKTELVKRLRERVCLLQENNITKQLKIVLNPVNLTIASNGQSIEKSMVQTRELRSNARRKEIINDKPSKSSVFSSPLQSSTDHLTEQLKKQSTDKAILEKRQLRSNAGFINTDLTIDKINNKLATSTQSSTVRLLRSTSEKQSDKTLSKQTTENRSKVRLEVATDTAEHKKKSILTRPFERNHKYQLNGRTYRTSENFSSVYK